MKSPAGGSIVCFVTLLCATRKPNDLNWSQNAAFAVSHVTLQYYHKCDVSFSPKPDRQMFCAEGGRGNG